jgi:hypothetical protein
MLSPNQRLRFTPIFHERLRAKMGAEDWACQQGMWTHKDINTAIIRRAEREPEFVIGNVDRWKDHVKADFCQFSSRRPHLPSTDRYEGWTTVGRMVPFNKFDHPGPDFMATAFADRSMKHLRDASIPILYHQFDIDFGIANIIFHFFKHLDLPVLKQRIDFVESLPKGSDERREAKKRIYRSLNMTDPEPDIDLHREALKIKREMEQQYAGFVFACQKKREMDGKDRETWFAVAMQILYEDVESTLMVDLARALRAVHIQWAHPSVFVADSIWVLKCVSTWANTLDLINGVSARYGCKFSFVPATNGLGFTDETCDEVAPKGHVLFSENAEYKKWREWFEKECFGDASSAKFVVLDHKAKTFSLKTKQNLIDVVYARFLDSGDKSLLGTWLADKERKMVRCIVNKPPPLVADEDEFNLWDFQGGFRAAQLPEVPADFNSGAAIETIVACFRRLVGNNEDQLTYLLNYLACELQEPARKVQQYVAFYGGQGTGKTELVVNFWCRSILGEANYVEYSDMTQFFEKHEVGWMGKSAIVVNEVEHGDFTSNYRKLKAFTGTISVKANEKCQSIISVDNYSRIFLTSNCINAFAEKDTVARRAGLRAAGYHYRDIEGSLATLRCEKAQRAFYDFLMARDISEWEPERDRLDNELLAGANQQLAFFAHEGKEAMVALFVTMEKMFEIMGTFKADGSREQDFIFPVQVMASILKANKRFTEDKSDKIWEMVANKQLLAATHELGDVLKKIDGQHHGPFKPKSGKGKKLRVRGFKIDYLALKDKLAEKMVEDRWSDAVDIDDYADKSLAAIDAWMESLGEKWEHCPGTPRSLSMSSGKTARRVNGTIQVRDGLGTILLETDDLEEVNKELGEAFVTETNGVRTLHRKNRVIELNDWFGGDYWATKVAMIYPDYIRDRTL